MPEESPLCEEGSPPTVFALAVSLQPEPELRCRRYEDAFEAELYDRFTFPPHEPVDADTDGFDGLTRTVKLAVGSPAAPEILLHETVKVVSEVSPPVHQVELPDQYPGPLTEQPYAFVGDTFK